MTSTQWSLWGVKTQPAQAVEGATPLLDPALGTPSWYATLVRPRPVANCARCGHEALLYCLPRHGMVCALCMDALSQEAEIRIRQWVLNNPDRSTVLS